MGAGSRDSACDLPPRSSMKATWCLVASILVLCLHVSTAKQGLCPGNTTVDEVTAGYNLTGTVAIVTGGDSGLGYATTYALAQRGATVYIGDRNLTKGQAAAKAIAGDTGGDVRFGLIDLTSFASVRAFAATFLKGNNRLDLLINNAGMGSNTGMKTKDGYEMTLQVDYLGHFLLTELLLPTLRHTGDTNGKGARVINLASDVHLHACELAGWKEGCFKDWTHLPPPVVAKENVTVHYPHNVTGISGTSLYGTAKWLLIQHAAELAKREAKPVPAKGAGVKAFSVHPGSARTSHHGLPWENICNVWYPQLPPYQCPFTPNQAVSVVGVVALHDGLESGGYYSRVEECGLSEVAAHGFTQEMGPELYDRTKLWVSLK